MRSNYNRYISLGKLHLPGLANEALSLDKSSGKRWE